MCRPNPVSRALGKRVSFRLIGLRINLSLDLQMASEIRFLAAKSNSLRRPLMSFTVLYFYAPMLSFLNCFN